MAEANESIIIDVQVNDKEAESRFKALRTRLAEVADGLKKLKQQQKENDKAWKDGTITAEEYAQKNIMLKAGIAELNKEQKVYESQAKSVVAANNIIGKSTTYAGGSIAMMRKNVTDLQAQYRQLTKVERESAAGKEMLKNIQDLEAETREAETAMRDFKTNIGNYPSALQGAFPALNKMQNIMSGIGVSMEDLKANGTKAFSGLGKSIKSFGKIFMTPPIIIITVILSAIVAAAKKLKQAFQKNDEAGTRLAKSLAPLKVVGQALAWVFDKIATGVSKAVEWFAKMAKESAKASALMVVMAKLFPEATKKIIENIEAQEAYVVAVDNLEQADRDLILKTAQNNKEIARLRNEAKQRDKYDAAERIKKVDEAIKLEKDNLKMQQENAAEHLRILEEEARLNSDTSDEMADKITQARAKMIEAEEAYYTGTQRLVAERAAAIKENENEEKKKTEDLKRRLKERQEAREADLARAAAIEKQYQEALFNTLQNESEKAIAQEKLQTNNEIKELNDRLQKEKLTEKEKDQLRKIIEIKENELAKKITQIRAAASEEALAREYAGVQKNLELKIQQEKKNSEEYFNLRYEALQRQFEFELQNENLNSQERLNLELKFNIDKQALEDEQAAAALQRAKLAVENEFEYKLLAAGDNAAKIAQITHEKNVQEYNDLVNLDQAARARLFESQEAYEAAVIESNKRMIGSGKQVASEAVNTAEKQLSMVSSIMGSMADVFGAMAGDSAAFAQFQQMVALAQAGVELGMAIAAATSAATSGDPYTVAIRIAAAVAAVVTSFAAVVKNIKSAKIPSPPAFAGGGVVPGTSYTGDNVLARLNSGEVVSTAQQWRQITQIVGELSNSRAEKFDYEKLAEAMAAQPAPVLALKEFNDFQKKVKRIELKAK